MSTISVIIPAKNDADMLERCLVALHAQTRPPDEIILVDNGSTDGTASVARRSGVTVIEELRPGITAAASRGYDAASGTILARCDADSVVPPGWVAHIARTLDANPEVVASTGPARFYDLGPIVGALARVFYLDAYFYGVGAAIANTPLFGSNFAMRASLWHALSATVPRDMPDLHDDFDLSYRIRPNQRVLFDRAMTVGISGRPFADAARLRRRLTMARVTMRQHLPRELPHRRWRERLSRTRADYHPAATARQEVEPSEPDRHR